MDTVDLRAQALARKQYGRATRRQLLAAGISRATITRRIQADVWTQNLPGVVDLRTHAESWRGNVFEAVLAAGADAWASHGTAAHLHRFLDAGRPPRLDVLVPRGRRHRVGSVELRTTRAIGADEVTERHGIPCTTPARTLLDLALSSPPDELERWAADLIRRRRLDLRAVTDLCDRHRDLPGRRRLIDVLARLPDAVGDLGSPLEVAGVQRLRRLGAPDFVLQYLVRDADGARIKRVDVAWPDLRTLLEFDGAAYHGLVAARAHDEQVRARMRALGWDVVVATRADLDGPLLTELVRRLRATAS